MAQLEWAQNNVTEDAIFSLRVILFQFKDILSVDDLCTAGINLRNFIRHSDIRVDILYVDLMFRLCKIS